MIATIHEAAAALKEEGLEVREREDHLWIAATIHDSDIGVRYANDVCLLMEREDDGVAVFPSKGLPQYEIPGDLTDLVGLIIQVYRHYRKAGCSYCQAVEDAIPHVEQYLNVGHSVEGSRVAAAVP